MQKRIRVESSNLKSVGYDNENQCLEIEFQDGSIYQYFKIPDNVHHELMNAESHGKYFIANIRNKYKYQKIS